MQPQDELGGFGSQNQPPANPYVPPTTPSRTPTSQPEYPGGFVPYNPPTLPTTPSNERPVDFPSTGGNGGGGAMPKGNVL